MSTSSNETTVVNKRNHVANHDDVYIGRGSRWGNPYVIGKDGTRGAVITKYTILMHDRLTGPYGDEWKLHLRNLRGRTLVCYCAPKQCHGDVLIELMRYVDEQQI